MRHNKSYMPLLAVVLCTVSCSDFLDTKPRGTLYPDTYYTTEANLEAALTGIYSNLGNSNLYGNNFVSQLGNDADESYYFRSTYTYGPVIYNHTSSSANIANLWQILYNGIGRANMLLYRMPDAVDVDKAVKDRIRGEALFLRAYFYFLLVENFGAVPLELEPALTPENLDREQSDIATIYDRIVKDMTEAESLVQSIDEIGHGGRVSKSAVRGILGRVYLTMAGYPLNDRSKLEEARKVLKTVIEGKEYRHSLNPDYNQVFINYAQDKYDIGESIWEVEFWGNRTDAYQETGTIGGLNGIANNYDNEIGLARGMYAATGTLYKKYEEGDLRRDRSIAPFTYHSVEDPENPGTYVTTKSFALPEHIWRRYPGKYRREEEILKPKAPQETPINFPLLRYSDVLLMYAEVENELGNGPSAEAYDAVNQVRRRAFGKLMPGASNVEEHDFKNMTYEEFAVALRDERSRELCFESLRKYDLIRWGIFVPTMRSVLDDIEFDSAAISDVNQKPPAFASNAFSNVSEKHLLQPIPSKELSLNRKLKQNEGW